MVSGDQATPKPPLSLPEWIHPLPGNLVTLLVTALNWVLSHDRTAWALIGIGWLARIGQYAANRSLWQNEAYLALNLITRSYGELLNQLDYHQNAPIGFLLIVRWFIEMFGASEYVLRLFPLVCGLLSVILFAAVVKRVLPREAAYCSLALFALSDSLIYYSSEFKQYSTDIMATLLLFLVTLWLLEKRSSFAFLCYTVVGAAIIWLSHPAVLVLSGFGLSVFAHFLAQRAWRPLIALCFAIGGWLISFAFEYSYFLVAPVVNKGLRASFSSFFLSFPPTSVKELYAYLKFFLLMFDENLGLPFVGIAALFFFLGVAALWRHGNAGSWLTLPPILMTLMISLLNIYPSRGRLVLFLVPMFVIVIGAGAGSMWTRVRGAYPTFGLVALGLLFFYPVFLSTYHLIGKPRIRQELRQILTSARDRIQAGDTIYVDINARPAFHYYAEALHLPANLEVIRKDDRDAIFDYVSDLEEFRGRPRVWFVFTSSVSSEDIDSKPFLLAYLRHIGKQEWGMEISNERQKGYDRYDMSASMYLFDLSVGKPGIVGQANRILQGRDPGSGSRLEKK